MNVLFRLHPNTHLHAQPTKDEALTTTASSKRDRANSRTFMASQEEGSTTMRAHTHTHGGRCPGMLRQTSQGEIGQNGMFEGVGALIGSSN